MSSSTDDTEASDEYARVDPQLIRSLLAELENKNGLARQRARQALVDIGSSAAPGLIGALESHNSNVRWEAAKALGEIISPSAAPGLVRALEDRDFGVRWLAAEALIGLGRQAAVPVLKALIEGARSTWLREGAHHVLSALAEAGMDKDLRPVLLAIKGTQPGDEVPVAAHRALLAIA